MLEQRNNRSDLGDWLSLDSISLGSVDPTVGPASLHHWQRPRDRDLVRNGDTLSTKMKGPDPLELARSQIA